MTTDTTLISLAMLRINSDSRADVYEYLRPYLIHVIYHYRNQSFSASDAQAKLHASSAESVGELGLR